MPPSQVKAFSVRGRRGIEGSTHKSCSGFEGPLGVTHQQTFLSEVRAGKSQSQIINSEALPHLEGYIVLMQESTLCGDSMHPGTIKKYKQTKNV